MNPTFSLSKKVLPIFHISSRSDGTISMIFRGFDHLLNLSIKRGFSFVFLIFRYYDWRYRVASEEVTYEERCGDYFNQPARKYMTAKLCTVRLNQ